MPSARAKPSARELKLASQIVDSLTSDWDPRRYHDTYTEQVKDLIEAKAKGKSIAVEEQEEPAAKVLDLMAALEASVEGRRKSKGARHARPASKGSGKRTAAKRAAKASKRGPATRKRASA